MRIELLRDYRGIKINDELWLKGIYEVPGDLGTYLIGKGYARASNEPLPEPPVVEPPDGIKAHNEAVKDLGLPSHLKVKPLPTPAAKAVSEADVEAFIVEGHLSLEGDTPDYSILSREDLIEMAEIRGIEVEGTGKDGYITKQDLLDALEGGED